MTNLQQKHRRTIGHCNTKHGCVTAGRYYKPANIPSWAVAGFANPRFNDLDVPENPGSIYVRSMLLALI